MLKGSVWKEVREPRNINIQGMSRGKRTSKDSELLVREEGKLEAKGRVCFKKSVEWQMVRQNRR